MDWFTLVKLAHIACAVVWVGGGFALMLAAARADRAGDMAGTLQIMRMIGDLGNRLFMPMSMLTLLFGLVMCWFWVGFTDLWIVLGLIGFAASALIGMTVFKPTADRMNAMIAKDGVTPAAMAEGRRILTMARLDYTVMLLVVADMVLKPSADQAGLLAVMAVVLVIGAASAFAGPGRAAAADA
ncbi:MAG: DUF2269 family protein [Rhizobiaceae bacterium]